MNLSEKIKLFREAKRIRQIDLAKSLDLDPSYYARLEKRGDKMSVLQLKQIADALGAQLIDLIGYDSENGVFKEKIELLEKQNELLIREVSILKKEIELMYRDSIYPDFSHMASGEYKVWQATIKGTDISKAQGQTIALVPIAKNVLTIQLSVSTNIHGYPPSLFNVETRPSETGNGIKFFDTNKEIGYLQDGIELYLKVPGYDSDVWEFRAKKSIGTV